MHGWTFAHVISVVIVRGSDSLVCRPNESLRIHIRMTNTCVYRCKSNMRHKYVCESGCVPVEDRGNVEARARELRISRATHPREIPHAFYSTYVHFAFGELAWALNCGKLPRKSGNRTAYLHLLLSSRSFFSLRSCACVRECVKRPLQLEQHRGCNHIR